MRKIIAASVIGLALVATQAVASNGAAQTLRVGDRVGAALGEREDFVPAWMPFSAYLTSMGPILATITVLGVTYVTVAVIDEVTDDGEDSPS